jgi:hypothetical protein
MNARSRLSALLIAARRPRPPHRLPLDGRRPLTVQQRRALVSALHRPLSPRSKTLTAFLRSRLELAISAPAARGACPARLER